jgi:SAM-dependent methyltransferase
MTQPTEQWSAGATYEKFMGHWSAAVAKHFLQWIDHATAQRWLDIGCGTGALTRQILSTAAPALTIGTDPSLNFVRYATHHTNGAHFLVSDARALAIRDNTFDHVVSGLALNFIPNPERALREMVRVGKPGGWVAAYVWDYAGKMEFLRCFWDAAVQVDANASALHEGQRFPLCAPDPLRHLWEETALQDVEVEALEITTPFADFEQYWNSFTVGTFPAPAYLSSLPDPLREQLREQLRASIPTTEEGAIHMIARAWAVRGRIA